MEFALEEDMFRHMCVIFRSVFIYNFYIMFLAVISIVCVKVRSNIYVDDIKRKVINYRIIKSLIFLDITSCSPLYP
jgi:hypothetical protein